MCTGEMEAGLQATYPGRSLLSTRCPDPKAQRAGQDKDEVWLLPAHVGGGGMRGDSGWRGIAWVCVVHGAPPAGYPRRPLRGRFPLSAASGLSSGRSSLRRNRIQVAGDSGTVRWGPGRDWEAGGSWGQGPAAGFCWGLYCSLRVPVLTLLPSSPCFLELT